MALRRFVASAIVIGVGTIFVYRILQRRRKSKVVFVKSKSPQCVLLIGSPGAGKGTLSKLAQDSHPNIKHYSCGDLLRGVASDHPHFELIKSRIATDGVVPVEITLQIMKEAMKRELNLNEHAVFLIDGFPRNQDNLNGWNQMMSEVDLKGVILLHVDVDVAKQRIIGRNRDCNDRAEILDERIQRRKERAVPVIAHYKDLQILHEINANASVEKVFPKFDAKLRELFRI